LLGEQFDDPTSLDNRWSARWHRNRKAETDLAALRRRFFVAISLAAHPPRQPRSYSCRHDTRLPVTEGTGLRSFVTKRSTTIAANRNRVLSALRATRLKIDLFVLTGLKAVCYRLVTLTKHQSLRCTEFAVSAAASLVSRSKDC